MTDAMLRPARLARSSRLVVYAILIILNVGCSGNGASPGEAPVERPAVSPVSRRPVHEATTVAVPEPPAHDEAAFLVYLEERLNRSQFDALRSAMSEQFVTQVYPTGTFSGLTFQDASSYQIRVTSTEAIGIGPLVRFIEDQGIEVMEARRLRPSLEEVFVQVTGLALETMKKEKEKIGYLPFPCKNLK